MTEPVTWWRRLVLWLACRLAGMAGPYLVADREAVLLLEQQAWKMASATVKSGAVNDGRKSPVARRFRKRLFASAKVITALRLQMVP